MNSPFDGSPDLPDVSGWVSRAGAWPEANRQPLKGLIMKRFAILTVITLVGLLAFDAGTLYAASANTNALTVNFTFTGAIQAPNVATTNIVTATTNTTYAVTKVRFANKDLLSLLSLEFATAFPVGARLGLTTSFNFVVLDQAGNIFMDVSTNSADSSYVFNITNNSSPVITGKVVQAPSKTTEVVTEIEPDFTFYYADGKGNNFHFGGLVTIKANAVVMGSTTTFKTVSLVISGSGGGVVFNPNDLKYDTVVFTGPWKATGSGISQ